jgi:hypothetical protein
MSTLLLSSPDNSVIRGFKAPIKDLPTPMFAPLRLLSVIPSAPEGRRFTSDITIKALEEVSSAPTVQYRPLLHHEATLENVQRHVNDFGPHIVHYEGYLDTISYRIQAPDPPHPERERLLLAGGFVGVQEFATMLGDSDVELLVVGRNGVSRIYENACATATFSIAEKGLSVLAPMRAIDDTSATTFTTEFYRAFSQGNKIESALHLARRNLASKGGDWTAFALFTDPDRLQYLELLPTTA